MTLFFSLSWLYHVFDNFQKTSKQKPWTPRSNINHQISDFVVPMFLSCFTISRSRVWCCFFWTGPRVIIGWFVGIMVIIILNSCSSIFEDSKKNSWKLCTEKFKAGLCLRSFPSTNGDSHGIHVAVFLGCVCFFVDMFLHQQRLQHFFLIPCTSVFRFVGCRSKISRIFSPWQYVESVSGFGIPRWQTGLVWCDLWKSWILRWRGISGRQPGSKMIFRTQGPKKHATWWLGDPGDPWKWSMLLGDFGATSLVLAEKTIAASGCFYTILMSWWNYTSN